MSVNGDLGGRRRLVGGNWKMHHLRADAESYCRAFAASYRDLATEVVLFPSATLLTTVARGLGGGPIGLGGQDVHPEAMGAHTGDLSGGQLTDAGCGWALCGHSERRNDHGESDELVGRKVAAATAAGLVPMICIGETEKQRQAGETFAVLDRQLAAALATRPTAFALAYEPVWAIGTGQTATPEIAQQAHAHIRETLADLEGDEAAGARRILYGGSVNPDNAADLISRPDIDGFLVGGASLDPERFLTIIRCCG